MIIKVSSEDPFSDFVEFIIDNDVLVRQKIKVEWKLVIKTCRMK